MPLGEFPLTAKYDPRWIRDNALGENALCQVESLARRLPLRPGMRVLDLGCGRATSSIFMAREFGVQVWAVDVTISPTDNRRRAIELGCESSVFPLQVDARALPFAMEFFDAVVAIDSFLYFGTDERYLSYLLPFLRSGGYIGMVDIAFTRELNGILDAPSHLRPHFPQYWSHVHCPQWWRVHWEKTGLVDVQCAESLPDSAQLLLNYAEERLPSQEEDQIMWAVPRDTDGLIELLCLVARKH
jgi:cyclopropane fatty-acyl-phospholipid synthase-like methyltransferase